MTIKTGKPAVSVEAGSPKGKISYRHLFKEKKAIQLLVCGVFVLGSTLAHNTYFGFLFRDGGGNVAEENEKHRYAHARERAIYTY